MPLLLATWLVHAIYAYVLAGLLLLPWWHLRGLHRLDPGAGRGPWGFRMLISPGLVALWPGLLVRALRSPGRPKTERNAHRDATKELSP